ncbi:tail fiber assembly protein [Pseudomonas sp. BT-42-2]|uniref:tail fiber assembly protein n=1 Tax=Pseudomonas sp. BT-42-2 TaxID=2986927 RepID=UPI0021F79964|nr:tail fiber assembly protein [Pseudomonas sp. BT-42-2]MCV9920621.1 tail fiber assembly protein [Pseudomonas sp. BT-42-2]
MDAPTTYNAHPETLEYIGQGLADPDPLEEGNWLVPALAFADSPPASSPGFAIVRNRQTDTWELVQDNRGTVYSTATGDAQENLLLGPLPDTLTREPFPGPLHTWNGSAWMADVDAQRDKAVALALALRDSKLAEAAIRIVPLEDAADVGEASEQELAALLAWKRYRIELNRVNQQADYPLAIRWPVSPDQAIASTTNPPQ